MHGEGVREVSIRWGCVAGDGASGGVIVGTTDLIEARRRTRAGETEGMRKITRIEVRHERGVKQEGTLCENGEQRLTTARKRV